jgi:hypothetical protein
VEVGEDARDCAGVEREPRKHTAQRSKAAGLNERLMLIIANALALIGNIARDASAAIAQRVPEVIEKAIGLTAIGNAELAVAAVHAIEQIVAAFAIEPSAPLEQIAELIEGTAQAPARAVFEHARECLHRGLLPNKETLAKLFADGMQALTRALPCQANGEEEDEGNERRGAVALADAVFWLMEELMSQCPAVVVEAALRKQHTIECARAAGILGRLFESARADFQGLLQKFLIQTVIGALQFCNGTVSPDPLTAVRRIADTDPGVLQRDMQTIWQAVVSSLQLEPRGQQFHRQQCCSESPEGMA